MSSVSNLYTYKKWIFFKSLHFLWHNWSSQEFPFKSPWKLISLRTWLTGRKRECPLLCWPYLPVFCGPLSLLPKKKTKRTLIYYPLMAARRPKRQKGDIDPSFHIQLHSGMASTSNASSTWRTGACFSPAEKLLIGPSPNPTSFLWKVCHNI